MSNYQKHHDNTNNTSVLKVQFKYTKQVLKKTGNINILNKEETEDENETRHVTVR